MVLTGLAVLCTVAYKLVQEKAEKKPADPNTPQEVSFFSKSSEEKDPIAQYSNLNEAAQGGDGKKETIQDDFDDEEEDI